MPRSKSSEVVIISSDDPQPLVSWLCDRYGLAAVLRSVAQYQAGGAAGETPGGRTSGKKRGPRKGSTKKGSTKKGGAKKAGAKRGSGGRGRGRKQAEAASAAA